MVRRTDVLHRFEALWHMFFPRCIAVLSLLSGMNGDTLTPR